MRGHGVRGDKRQQERVNLKAILADPVKRDQLVDAVIAAAAKEGETLTHRDAMVRIEGQLKELEDAQ